jgi:thiol-disulfide isomerase/thioredoxin
MAAAVFGADLRPVSDPAKIDAVFPKAAKLRVVNVWATWCAPCVAEMPDLRKVDETFGPEVAIAGISLDDMIPDAKSADVARFLDKQRIAFPNVYYTGNADALANHLKITGELPVTIVYDAKGKELWRHQGRIELEKTIAQLRELLRRTR